MIHSYSNITRWFALGAVLLVLSLTVNTAAVAQSAAPVWKVDAPTSNWFGTGNTERGLGYNPTTGNLIVASRQGGVKPILIDGETGDSVGILKTSIPAGVAIKPLWAIDAPTGGWFMTDNNTRGLTYNPATGNLIVASRSGGNKPVVINAATGDSVGMLSNADVQLSEDFEGISASGDAVAGWTFDNAQTYKLSGYGNNSDKYAGWGESSAADHSITSPAIVDPGVLTYYVAAFNDQTNTKVLVQVSSDSTNWTTLDTLTSKGAGGDFGVTFLKKTLTINGKGAHQIRWKTDSYVSGGFYLDDITVAAPISGGTFAYSQVRATADGQIFTANLAINAVTKIYRWASESAHPKLIFSDSLGQRLGDSFGVVGSGDSVTVLLSGTGATKVVGFSWDGAELTKVGDFPVAAGEARGGFSSRAYSDSILISGTGTAPRFMNIKDGALGTQLASDSVDSKDLNSVMTNDQLLYDGRHLVAVGPAFTNGKFYLLDITDGVKLVHTFEPLGDNANGNNAGAALFDEANGRLYLMDTNNSIQAFAVSDFFNSRSPITGGTFPYNQIRATEDGQIFTANLAINGVTKIYRWADEDAYPELIFSDSLGQRLGDSFGAFGSGNAVSLTLSGSGATKVVAFQWDGSKLTKVADLPVAAGEARGGFSSRTVNNNTIITGTGTAPRFMNTLTGELGAQIKSFELDEKDLNSVMLNDHFIVDGFHVMVAGPAFENGKFYVLDITSPGNAKVAYEFEPLGVNTNGNNTGGVIFDEENLRLYLMDTNNSLQAFDYDDLKITLSTERDGELVTEFGLGQNFPNPFNPSTKINFSLPKSADVTLTVYNVLGQEVARLLNGTKYASGKHEVSFNAAGLNSGMYLYRIQAGEFTAQRTMMLIK